MSSIIFNDEQKLAIDKMVEFMGDQTQHFFLLEGYAGTGKTTCVQEVVKILGLATALTAPTNKATRVLMEMSTRFGATVTCCTIYSLMGLRLRGTGEKQTVVPEGESKMPNFKLVVVDEASMCNKEVFLMLVEQAYNYGTKVIFMGDPAQLPPVGEVKSPVFTEIGNKAVLDRVMRHDNQILTLATAVRRAWAEGHLEPGTFKTDHDENGGVWCVDSKKFRNNIEKAFTSESYKDDPSKVRIVAWTNEAVRGYNETVRELLYGEDRRPFHEGERVIACAPVIDADHKKETKQTEITMTTDEEAVVIKVVEKPHPIFPRFICNALVLESDDGSVNIAYVIHPDYEKALKECLDNMAEEAKARKASWSSFWEMKELFHDIRPCHAITAHRAQGSTYDTVLVDVDNIKLNRREKEMLQCLYVAVSRASRIVVARTR